MFFTGKKGPKTFFSTQKNLFLKIFFLQKNIVHIKKIKVKFSQIFLMIISSQKRQNKIAKTKKAPGNRIRVNKIVLCFNHNNIDIFIVVNTEQSLKMY